jgi:hypothetical protein
MSPHRLGPSHAETKINDKIVELYHIEEVMWRHRSRIQWLSECDKIANFFHQRESMRRSKNNIKKLAREDGSVTKDTR